MQMKVEKRDDGSIHIEGYVNAVERESRELRDTVFGKFTEMIQAGVFQRAIDKADKVDLMVDHERTIGDTKTNLTLYEDSIGLRAILDTNDEYVVENSSNLKGWSFGFRDAEAILEKRDNKPILRTITDLILDEVSLIIDKTPAYYGTIAEVREDSDNSKEYRAYTYSEVEVTDRVSVSVDTDLETVTTSETHTEVTHSHTYEDLTTYIERLNALKK